MELTEEQIRFIKSTRLWQTAQDNLCSQLNLNIENSEKMIKNHNAILSNSKEQLDFEMSYTKKGMQSYFEWCDSNGIDPYIKL